MNVLMIGPPGSGKGTHGVKLAEHLGLRHIAVGDLLRAEIKNQTPVGRRVQALVEQGELVPDLLVVGLLMPVILDAVESGGYVLDGYPRSVPQAELTRHVVDDLHLGAEQVIYLDVPEDELVRRILARAEIEGRSDDTAEVVANRLKIFNEATRPLIDYYRERGVLQVIDANRDIPAVTADVIAAAQSGESKTRA